MRLLFMRHGQTNYNLLGLCNGDPARDVHLTDTGIQQAMQAAEQLKTQRLDLILVSELPRTRQTAEIVNRTHQAEIRVHPAINDIRSGCEDRPVAEYQTAIAGDRLRGKVNDGESLLEYKQRVMDFLLWLQQQSWPCVLVVAHEETLRVVTAHFEHLPDEAMPDLHFANCQILSYTAP